MGCSRDESDILSKHVVGWQGLLLRFNALIVVNTILMGVIAGIGAYRLRYRHHPLIRFIYIGATTLFIPIVSYVVSTLEDPYSVNIYTGYKLIITATCYEYARTNLVILWIGLVQIVGTNATAIVAGDTREGRSIAPPAMQLFQAIWTSYLVYTTIVSSGLISSGYFSWSEVDVRLFPFFAVPYALVLAKLLFKYYAWYMARRSLALGCNPRLIVGYMERLHYGAHQAELLSPPPLIVMREGTVSVEKEPHGYSLIGVNNNGGLVTVDRVWQLNDGLLAEQHKDLCLSFALFKLLRCRFARYTVSEAGFMKVSNFIRHVILKDSDDERVLGVIAHELSFLHDYYYTSLPISYSQSWLPMLSLSVPLSSIVYCLLAMVFLVKTLNFSDLGQDLAEEQFICECNIPGSGSLPTSISFGSIAFDYVPALLLMALVVLVEAKEIVSYICSNWTKVALICHYVEHTCWQQSPTIRKCVGYMLRTRCRLLDHWEDKMNQCSVLALYPRRSPVALLRRLLHLPDQKKKVPRAVKAAVVDAVRRYDQRRIKLRATPLPIQLGSDLLWTFDGAKGVADAMLVCHVATSILEARSRHHKKPLSDHEVVATHLSRYCAYLVAYSPEILPDDALWCSSLYKAVKKDATRVLSYGGTRASMAPEAEDQRLIKLLSERSEHQVLKDGAELGARLAQLADEGGEEDVAWKALAGFWSETIVSVAASSDNMDEHAEAVARGGELVTLLWALLAHLGSDVDDDTAVAAHGAPPPDV